MKLASIVVAPCLVAFGVVVAAQHSEAQRSLTAPPTYIAQADEPQLEQKPSDTSAREPEPLPATEERPEQQRSEGTPPDAPSEQSRPAAVEPIEGEQAQSDPPPRDQAPTAETDNREQRGGAAEPAAREQDARTATATQDKRPRVPGARVRGTPAAERPAGPAARLPEALRPAARRDFAVPPPGNAVRSRGIAVWQLLSMPVRSRSGSHVGGVVYVVQGASGKELVILTGGQRLVAVPLAAAVLQGNRLVLRLTDAQFSARPPWAASGFLVSRNEAVVVAVGR